MTKKELNEMIQEELQDFLSETEDMDAEAGPDAHGEEHEDVMDELKAFYEKLKAHFDADEDEMEDEEEGEELDEGASEEEEIDEIVLNESFLRMKKLANLNG